MPNVIESESDQLRNVSSALSACLARLADEKLSLLPMATYRLQLNRRFRFEDARKLVPYLAQLGISHLYSSPILMAREGSQHGYDIIDHNQLNPEIGTEEEFRELVAELKRHGMSLLLDIVPNHMGVGHGNNPWWQDVLQNGRTSAYADFFDIDWEPLKPELRNKVLIPILGHSYGEDLESGNIRLSFEDGKFLVKYFDKVLPLDPQTIPLIFATEHFHSSELENPDLVELTSILNGLGRLPVNSTTEPDEVRRRQHESPQLIDHLQQLAAQSAAVQRRIQAVLQSLNGTPGDAASFDALHTLLEHQAYRLAFWRVSGEEINYRRFFDINDLVGLRMENPRVFAETHRLIRRFLAEGLVSGLRLDHPDGLLNPSEYIVRLQRLYAASRCLGAEPVAPLAPDGIELDVHTAFGQNSNERHLAPLYLLLEKILEAGEHVPNAWAVDGTVGYEFADAVNNVFIDQNHQRAFTKLYERIVGRTVRIQQLIYDSKKLVMRRALASEVNVLAHRLNDISNQDRRARDFTLAVLREAIRETIACFPVYRTYIDQRAHVSRRDRKYIEEAIECAKQQSTSLAPAVFDFLRDILLLQGNDGGNSLYGYRKTLYFTLKFQQLTGPVMAKGLEDTTCYVYSRFISVNEVGGSPANFGIPVAEFHCGNQKRAEHWPHSMLSTSTHDTKRSEDVRARLNVLSELPNAWGVQVMKWRRINRNRKVKLPDGRLVPDNNEEYFLYQTLVGTWPLQPATEEERRKYCKRIQQYMEKAVHEAKVNASWLNPNPNYVDAMNAFIEALLSHTWRSKPNLFWDSMQKFSHPITYFGFINALAQTLLKLTSPGAPDIYQGQEMWDFSLVDPDNRREVDFEIRQRLLEQFNAEPDEDGFSNLCRDLLRQCWDGRVKLWLTLRTLDFRRRYKEIFRDGSYTPLYATRGREQHIIAFARVHGEEASITVVPRLTYTLMRGKEEPPLRAVWGETEISLPEALRGRTWRDVLTGGRIAAGEALLCCKLFSDFPVVLLSSE